MTDPHARALEIMELTKDLNHHQALALLAFCLVGVGQVGKIPLPTLHEYIDRIWLGTKH